MAGPLLLVVAAVLVNDARHVLIAQRPEGKTMAGLWEFPGGKVDPGETPEDALVRELDEELGIGVRAADLVPLTFASHAYAAFHLLMPVYIVRRWTGEPYPRDVAAIRFIPPSEISDYPMPAADRPLINCIVAQLTT